MCIRDRRKEPRIAWGVGDSRLKEMTLLFLDIDAGSGVDRQDLKRSGRLGPYPHSVWSNCKAASAPDQRTWITPSMSCKGILKPYQPPGNSGPVPNRYAFVLFEQAKADAIVNVSKAFPGAPRKWKFGAHWDMARFLADNPGLTPAGYNFMLVRGDGSKAGTKARGRRG